MLKTAGLIFLALLKVLGILLLIIILTMFVLLFCILVIPVRYRVGLQNLSQEEGRRKTGRELLKSFRGQFDISWFLRLVHVTARYEAGQVRYTIKIAGIDLKKRAATSAKAAKKSSAEAGPDSTDTISISEKEENDFVSKLEQQADTGSAAERVAGSGQQERPEKGQEKTEQKKKEQKKKEPKKKEQEKKEQKKARQDDPADTQRIKSLTSIRDRIQKIREEAADEFNRAAIARLRKEFIFLVRHYSPRYLEADLTFSMADPAVTGKLLGIISLCPVIYRYPVSIVPDFECQEFYVEGRIMAKGRIRGCIFLVSGLRLLMDRSFMHTARRLMGRST